MDTVDPLGGLKPIRLSPEQRQQAAVMKVAFKTAHHFFGGFSPSVRPGH